MLASMSSRLFSEWMAFAQLEPFGWNAGNILAANVCRAAVAPYIKSRLEDWLLRFESPDAQTWQDMKEILKQTTQGPKTNGNDSKP